MTNENHMNFVSFLNSNFNAFESKHSFLREQDQASKATFFQIYFTIQSIKVFKNVTWVCVCVRKVPKTVKYYLRKLLRKKTHLKIDILLKDRFLCIA